ncbi:phosphotransferase [Nakamurella sp. YIM 132087]|uniref:Phosphotransferase n=1 Tax=Nakamurella alba TaxID=2665158 RepID=A0A7K1FP85_9ACTN|nr:phosphotransferase family protein [Nakamurella alba]MTD15962.1 phosphotransferase [Nakamurella alba]
MTAPPEIRVDEETARKVLLLAGLADEDDRVGVRRLTAGASRAMFLLQVRPEHAPPDGPADRYVLRLQGDTLGAAHGLRLEAGLLELARSAGVPAPRVRTVQDDGALLGLPYLLMDHVAGDTLPKRILSAPGLAAARGVLPAQLGVALGALHGVPVESTVARLDGLAVGADEIAVWRDILDSYDQPHPAFELGMRWLEEHRPAPLPPVLLHGDFRVGNIIVDPSGLAAVLDWELAHIGDPREDLGWLCAPSWRFGSPLPVGGVGDYEQLLTPYREATGLDVTAPDLHWFEVLGTLRWGVLCVGQTMRHLRSTTRSVELAALGRRVCEIEWDLLEAIT